MPLGKWTKLVHGKQKTGKRKKAAAAVVPAFSTTKSLAFNGTTGYVIGTNHVEQDFTTAMSVSVWVKGSGATATILDKSYPTRGGYWLYGPYPSGQLWSFWGFTNISTYTARNTSINAFDGTWHMLTTTWNSGVIKMYVDGTEDTSLAVINNGATSMGSNVGALILGADQFPSVGTTRDFYTGRMCNVSLWNTVLTGTDVANLRTAGKPADLSQHAKFSNCKGWYRAGDGDATGANNILDSSGNSFHMTINGGVTIVSDAP